MGPREEEAVGSLGRLGVGLRLVDDAAPEIVELRDDRLGRPDARPRHVQASHERGWVAEGASDEWNLAELLVDGGFRVRGRELCVGPPGGVGARVRGCHAR